METNTSISCMYNKTDLVETLVQKDDRLQAIRYIYAFELVEKFPPVPLLRDHVSYTKELVVKIRKEGKHSKHAAVCHLNLSFLKLIVFISLKCQKKVPQTKFLCFS